MRLTGRRGRLAMRLQPGEIEVLGELFDDLDATLGAAPAAGTADAVLQRLFPAGYRDDEEAATEFRLLTEGSLREERHDRLAACRADLAVGREVDLTEPGTAQRWLQVLNDLRLTLGTRLEVGEDDDREVDVLDPEQRPHVLYHWLTYVQDTVVTALMR